MPLWIKILLSVVAVEALGGLGAAITSDQISGWYASLNKPPGTPPNWLFGPVWVILYALIGIALALVWDQVPASAAKRTALIWFGVQFALNLAWTPVFFGMHQMLMALVIIVALWGCIIVTVVHFRRQRYLAGLLLFPYLVWVSYATYLNAGYWWLNR